MAKGNRNQVSGPRFLKSDSRYRLVPLGTWCFDSKIWLLIYTNQTISNSNSIRPEFMAEDNTKFRVNSFILEFMHRWM